MTIVNTDNIYLYTELNMYRFETYKNFIARIRETFDCSEDVH